MRALILRYIEELRASYWFIPAIMCVGAAVLAVGITEIDRRVAAEWIDAVQWLFPNKPEGARAVLSTIAGSMITVAATTFSITIASVTFASGQFGPRLLNNFLRDRGNQVALGTFIATFLYCLLVLRTVRSADEGTVESGEALGAFIPNLAILLGLMLAVFSIGVLIFFFHHVPRSILISNVVANIGGDLDRKMEDLFPQAIGEPASEVARREPEPEWMHAAFVQAEKAGYLESIDEAGLVETARTWDATFRLAYRPGDFVSAGQPLVWVVPAAVAEQMTDKVQDAFVWGNQRTPLQDIVFLFNELIEIAARALSPGINDPFTAMTCLDWLGNALVGLQNRTFPEAHRYDADGHLRVVTEPYTFAGFADIVFGRLRQYFAADRTAALHMLKVIADVGAGTEDPERRNVLAQHAGRLYAACTALIVIEEDRTALLSRYQTVLGILKSGDRQRRLSDRYGWLDALE